MIEKNRELFLNSEYLQRDLDMAHLRMEEKEDGNKNMKE